MITAVDNDTGQERNIFSNGNGELCVEQTPKYLDLGLVVNGDAGGNGHQLAAGAVATVPVVDNVEWVRNIIVMYKSPAAELHINRINTDGLQAAPANPPPLGATSEYISYTVSPTEGLGTASGLLGKSAIITIKNTSAAAADCWLAVQLLG